MSRRFLGSLLVTFGFVLLVVAPNAFAGAPRASVTEFPLPHADSRPYSIVTGPDGNLWFTESTHDAIGKITPDGTITDYPLHATDEQSGPYGIALGADGALWFTERFADKIGRLDPTTGTIQEFYVLSSQSQPWGITAMPDGTLWFTEENINNVGVILPNGTVFEYPVGGDAADLDHHRSRRQRLVHRGARQRHRPARSRTTRLDQTALPRAHRAPCRGTSSRARTATSGSPSSPAMRATSGRSRCRARSPSTRCPATPGSPGSRRARPVTTAGSRGNDMGEVCAVSTTGLGETLDRLVSIRDHRAGPTGMWFAGVQQLDRADQSGGAPPPPPPLRHRLHHHHPPATASGAPSATSSVTASAAVQAALHRPAGGRREARQGEDEDRQGALQSRHDLLAQARRSAPERQGHCAEPEGGPQARERRPRQAYGRPLEDLHVNAPRLELAEEVEHARAVVLRVARPSGRTRARGPRRTLPAGRRDGGLGLARAG